MRYLVDTNVFLQWLNADKKLKDPVLEILKDPHNQIYVSIASGWEISIKNRSGKLPLKTTLENCFSLSEFEILSINLNHVLKLNKLPNLHKDPFDRIIISQAIAENLILITSDKKIFRYKVDLVKC